MRLSVWNFRVRLPCKTDCYCNFSVSAILLTPESFHFNDLVFTGTESTTAGA